MRIDYSVYLIEIQFKKARKIKKSGKLTNYLLYIFFAKRLRNGCTALPWYKTKSTVFCYTVLDNRHCRLWRKEWDSNPRSVISRTHDFQSCALDQLSHLSIWSDPSKSVLMIIPARSVLCRFYRRSISL